ncbi:MAG: ABC transporter permease [Ottowia sp.]|nr:ABC transporter permease [Ottowia sp.]
MQQRSGTGRRALFGAVCGLVLLLALWQAACASGMFNSYVLPSPAAVLRAARRMFATGEIFEDILISLTRVLRGFGIAFVLAFLLGAFYLLFPRAGSLYQYLVHFFRFVPPLSLIPLLILWCGIHETTKTAIIVLASFFPIYLSIIKGFSSVDARLLEVGRAFGYSARASFWRITLPAALSDVLVGMRTGFGYAWRAIIGAEMVAASTGLGHMILFAQQTSRTDKVLVGVFVIGVVGLLCDRLFALAVRTLFRGFTASGWD